MASPSALASQPQPRPGWKWKLWSPPAWPRSRSTTCARPSIRESKSARFCYKRSRAAKAATTSARKKGRFMSNNVKVLLVDDNPMVLGMLKQALTPLAMVTTAVDGPDALLKAVDDPPDLLVSDYRMPGMDGRQLVEKLKSRPSTSGISVILLATKADITEKLGMPDVDDYVEKPFFLKELTQRTKRVIDKIALEKMAKNAATDGVL